MTKKPKTVTKEEAEKIQPDLEPAGYKREEQLAQRKDALEQQAEELSEQHGMESVDPTAFEEIREIQDIISKDGLQVEKAQPEYMYKWVNFMNINGNMVRRAQAEGWEVVQSNDPESPSLKEADGTRRIGDVLLMRMRKDYHLLREVAKEQKRLQQMYGAEAAVHALQQKYPQLFPDIDTESQPSLNLQATTTRRAARRVAAQHVGNRMKQGPIPGVPIPGQR